MLEVLFACAKDNPKNSVITTTSVYPCYLVGIQARNGKRIMNHWMDEARQFAAQCWCDDETKDRVMDPVLVEAVAKRIAVWMDTAATHVKNEDFYRSLLDRCVDNLHSSVRELAFTREDGSKSKSPLLLMVPHCVSELTERLNDAEFELRAKSESV